MRREVKELLGWVEAFWYVFSCTIAYNLLVAYHIYPSKDIGVVGSIITWVLTIVITGYLTRKHDAYSLKRKIRKLAKKRAIKQGLNPKDLDWESTKIHIDKDGYVDVEIAIKKKTTE